MHQLGKEMVLTVNGDRVSEIGAFSFMEQKNYPTERQVSNGDEIGVTCKYNESDVDVTFGDSSNKEMCFVGFYRYPATGEDFCTSDF
jgi:hypothetical protein